MPGRVVLVDGTEVLTGNRAATASASYSGKRHRRGLNVDVASDMTGNVLFVSDPTPALDTTVHPSAWVGGRRFSIMRSGEQTQRTSEPAQSLPGESLFTGNMMTTPAQPTGTSPLSVRPSKDASLTGRTGRS